MGFSSSKIDVQRDQDPSTQRVGVEERRNVQKFGFQEGLHDPHQLRGQVVLSSGKAVAQFGKALAGRLKHQPLQAEAVGKARQIDGRDLTDVWHRPKQAQVRR